LDHIAEGRRKREEGIRKKEEERGNKEEGRSYLLVIILFVLF
jgi:hypothetical protein